CLSKCSSSLLVSESGSFGPAGASAIPVTSSGGVCVCATGSLRGELGFDESIRNIDAQAPVRQFVIRLVPSAPWRVCHVGKLHSSSSPVDLPNPIEERFGIRIILDRRFDNFEPSVYDALEGR